MEYNKVITIKIGKSHGLATIKGDKIEVYKYPNSVVDLKFLLQGLTKDVKPIIAIETITLAGLKYMPHMAQQSKKRMFNQYQQVLSVMIDLDIPFVEVPERTWVKYLGLERPLEEKKEKWIRIGNACVYWFGGKAAVSRWNHRSLLLLRFMILKLQTDSNWIKERINNKELNDKIDMI